MSMGRCGQHGCAYTAEVTGGTRREFCPLCDRDALAARLAVGVAWAKEQGHTRWCAVHRPALYGERPCDCGLDQIARLTDSASGVQK